MEVRGLIERRAVAGDRRVKRVILTDQAAPVVRQIVAIDADLRTELFDGLAADEVQLTLDLLRKLRHRLG
jgi:MarR family transcriptional regulator for hemolysin